MVFHMDRRVSADRTRNRGVNATEVLTWAEIAEWARVEGLLDAEQAGCCGAAGLTNRMILGEARREHHFEPGITTHQGFPMSWLLA